MTVNRILDESRSNLISHSLKVNFLISYQISSILSHSRNITYFKSILFISMFIIMFIIIIKPLFSCDIYALNMYLEIFPTSLLSSNKRKIYILRSRRNCDIYPFVLRVVIVVIVYGKKI